MLHATHLTSKLSLLALLFLGTGCALFESQPERPAAGPPAQAFVGSYDEVWRAVQKALTHYPIQINNIEQGIIETDSIKGAQAWTPPFHKSQSIPNIRYSLRVNVIKGQTGKNESAKVVILKKIIVEKDFFSGEDQRPSDGYEEKALLYRISRELKLERSLRRAFEKRNI